MMAATHIHTTADIPTGAQNLIPLSDPGHVQHSSQMEMPSRSAAPRVCDKCMLKKRKCNRQRPACSRCLDDNIECVYTSVKRKPGPAKGSQRRKPNTRLPRDAPNTTSPRSAGSSLTTHVTEELGQPYTIDHEYESSSFVSVGVTDQLPESILSQQILPQSDATSATSFYAPSSVSQGHHSLNCANLPIPPDKIHEMLESFFTYVHPSFCLFDEKKFMQNYEQGLTDENLLITILAVSSHIQGLASLWTDPSLKRCLDQLLAMEGFDPDSVDDAIPISRFQQAFLLAFYYFHQYPGRKSWSRVGKLTREAYEWGLHQIDHPQQCQLYASNVMNTEEKEEWRRLWWCIYCLDSYCNITASTPFVIELDSVRTALIPDSIDITGRHQPALFLPPDTDRLWETCKAVSAHPGDCYVNVHIVTTTLLRKAGKLLRLWVQNPTPQIDEGFQLLDDHLSAVRLALFPRFFNVSRDIVKGESPPEHHARLICNLHMHATRLLVSMPRSSVSGEECWRHRWAGVLECCEDVVSIVKQWKTQLCPSVDPAICFIISGVLMLMHLHSIDIFNKDSSEFLARLRGQKELLRLFVEQFASIWHLPRFLTVSYEKFTENFSQPLAATEIKEVISKMGGSLNRIWMKRLSLTSDHLRPPEVIELDNNMLTEDDFRDWEFWTNIAHMTCMP